MIGVEKVRLYRTFSTNRTQLESMAPDHHKIVAVQEWPIPTNATEVRQFLGLASYYRRYIHQFADIANYCWESTLVLQAV